MEVGDLFPTEDALSEQLGVSRPTLRSALMELEGRGLIGRTSGRRRRTVLAIPTPAAGEGE
jgi:DNA-binding FadR family transcriptional regulator